MASQFAGGAARAAAKNSAWFKTWMTDPATYPVIALTPIALSIIGFFTYRTVVVNAGHMHRPATQAVAMVDFYHNEGHPVDLPYERFGKAADHPETPLPFSSWRKQHMNNPLDGR